MMSSWRFAQLTQYIYFFSLCCAVIVIDVVPNRLHCYQNVKIAQGTFLLASLSGSKDLFKTYEELKQHVSSILQDFRTFKTQKTGIDMMFLNNYSNGKRRNMKTHKILTRMQMFRLLQIIGKTWNLRRGKNLKDFFPLVFTSC